MKENFEQKLKKIIKKAIERGYYLQNQTAINTMYNFIRDDGLCLTVYPETEEFSFWYNVDYCTKLNCGKCSLFMDDLHFKAQEDKIAQYMYILKTALKAPCGKTTCDNCDSYPCFEHFGPQAN